MAPRIRKLAHLSDECVVGVVLDSDNRMAAANDFGVSTFTLDNELAIRGYQSYRALRTAHCALAMACRRAGGAHGAQKMSLVFMS